MPSTDCSWSPEQQQTIYRDWSLYCKRYGEINTSIKYASKAIDIRPDNNECLIIRSEGKQQIADIDSALADAIKGHGKYHLLLVFYTNISSIIR